jgi:hypothetical protein
MKLSAFQRRAILAGALVATVAAALMPAEPDAPPAQRAQPARPPTGARELRNRGAAEPLPQLELERLAQSPSREAVLDALEVRSWAPPPAKPAPPPPPQAPPLPFKYLGKIMDGGQVVVFLAKQDNNYMVREGDKLDNNYQIDEIKAGMMTLTYLPLGQKQTLAIGAVN